MNRFLASLPGSEVRGVKLEVASNNALMVRPNKLPGVPDPPRVSIPAPHLLGSGSKIPESYESRMRSQFSSPDPAVYSRKKRQEYDEDEESWWASGQRQPLMTCLPYKTDPSGKAVTSEKEMTREQKQLAAKDVRKAEIAKEAAKTHEKQLLGMKEGLLYSLCTNPNVKYGSPEISRVVNIVMDINKQLGLPASNMGSYKIPRD